MRRRRPSRRSRPRAPFPRRNRPDAAFDGDARFRVAPGRDPMKRVTGIGGVFFKSRDPKALGAWYAKHLGIDVQEWGGAAFSWNGPGNPDGVGTTVWSPFPAETTYFAPSAAPFMVNYRVDDL